MGEVTPSNEEFILALLPFPEDSKVDAILSSIQSKHPHVQIDFHNIAFTPGVAPNLDHIPEETWEKTTILVTLAALPPSLEVIPKLKLIHLISAGANHLAETPVWKETDIPFTNSSGIHSPQIAEWVIMQILSYSHQQKILLQWQKEHKWGPYSDLNLVQDGVGRRLGVLGYGAIGRQTARIAKALGLDVIAYTASPRPTPESKKDRGYIVPGTGDEDGLVPSKWFSGLDKASLHHFLRQDIDILLVSVPLTKETHHFLAKEEFALLKGAFVVNIARGPILQQDDLIAALKVKPEDGGLRGVSLDVTDPEPLPSDSELWDLENVTITPHISGLGTTYLDRGFEILEKNLTNIEQGKRLLNEVNKVKGY